MPKFEFSEHVKNVFATMDTTYDEMKSLMFDLYKGNVDGMSKAEAEDNLRQLALNIFGLTKDSSKRDRKRAYEAHAKEFFEIIEEVIDQTVTVGLRDNEWFNALVNYKNLRDGQENLFVTEDDTTVLSIARMGKRHHDTILQRLPENDTYSIETDLYGAAVGADIDLYLIGQEDWEKLVSKITDAFVKLIQGLIFTEVKAAVNKLPVQAGFVDTGALDADSRKDFNKILQNVSIANNNAPVVIFGTMVALQELENLIKVNWIADSQKEDVAGNSRLGNYGRYQLVEIPQRFKTLTSAGPTYEFDDNVLYVFASGDNKIVDMVDVGETVIDEVNERGEANGRIDDTKKYEVQREFGVGARFGKYFGQWTITE